MVRGIFLFDRGKFDRSEKKMTKKILLAKKVIESKGILKQKRQREGSKKFPADKKNDNREPMETFKK
jgi:hypothetical protein